MYSNKTNKTQRYTMEFFIINALHVSGGFFVHHQELKTVYTAELELTIAVRSRKSSTNTRCCVYGFELLMIGEGTA